ncbi:MAG: YsnF/AvaK domain-containing protein [Gemmatimonadaceae bacterium]
MATNSGKMGDGMRGGSDTSREVGEGVGGVAGIAAGAAIGSLAGPVGTVIGAIAGAVGGWWAGKDVAQAASGYTSTNDTYYQNQFASQPRGRFQSYDQARPLYQLGYVAAQNPSYRGKSFDTVESDMKHGWSPDMERQYGSWNDVRGIMGSAYTGANQSGTRGADQGATKDTRDTNDVRISRSEEELTVGKRQVSAGEVGLKKTVETEHVTKNVPLMREEVEIERHPVNASSANAGDVEIGEQDIRIPLTAEEAVVNKRVVAKEEVVVTKHAVQDTKEVGADLRKERIDVDKQGRTSGADLNDSDRDRSDNTRNR